MAIFQRIKNGILAVVHALKARWLNQPRAAALKRARYLQQLDPEPLLRRQALRIDQIVGFYRRDHGEDHALAAASFAVAANELRSQVLEGNALAHAYLLRLADVTDDRSLEYVAAETLAHGNDSRELTPIALMYYLRAAQQPLNFTPSQQQASILAKLKLSLCYASDGLRHLITALVQPVLGAAAITLPAIEVPRQDLVALRYLFSVLQENSLLTENLHSVTPSDYPLSDQGYFQFAELLKTSAASSEGISRELAAKAVACYERIAPHSPLFDIARYEAAHLLHYVLESSEQALKVLLPLIRKGDRDALVLQQLIQRSAPRLPNTSPSHLQSLEKDDDLREEDDDNVMTPAAIHAAFPERTPAYSTAYQQALTAIQQYESQFNSQENILIYQSNRRMIMPTRRYLETAKPLNREEFDDKLQQLAAGSPFRLQLIKIVAQAKAKLTAKDQTLPVVQQRLEEIAALETLLNAKISFPVELTRSGDLPTSSSELESKASYELELRRSGSGVATARLPDGSNEIVYDLRRSESTGVFGASLVTSPSENDIKKAVAEKRSRPTSIESFDDDTELYDLCNKILTANTQLSFWQRFRARSGFTSALQQLLNNVKNQRVPAYFYSRELFKALPHLLRIEFAKHKVELAKHKQQFTKYEQEIAAIKSGTLLEQREQEIKRLQEQVKGLQEKIVGLEKTISNYEKDKKAMLERFEQYEQEKKALADKFTQMMEKHEQEKKAMAEKFTQMVEKFEQRLVEAEQRRQRDLEQAEQRRQRDLEQAEQRRQRDLGKAAQDTEAMVEKFEKRFEEMGKMMDRMAAETDMLKNALRQRGQMDDDIPGHLCCNISHQLMTDPVMTDDGYTYDRESIERWFKIKAGQTIRSPMTNLPLSSTKLLPNYKLRDALNEFLSLSKLLKTPTSQSSATAKSGTPSSLATMVSTSSLSPVFTAPPSLSSPPPSLPLQEHTTDSRSNAFSS